MKDLPNYIDGEFVAPESGEYLDNVEPAVGHPYARVPNSNAADVAHAVGAARHAFPAWSATPAAERSRVMLRMAEFIEARIDEFALAESVDSGKPVTLAREVDIPRAVANLRFFATAILHDQSEMHQTDNRAINYTLRSPLGVVALISPWNLPLYLLSWKVAPAIATGNTAVAKPSEITPATATLLAEVAGDSGLPAGVLNIIHGTGVSAGTPLTTHPEVRAISFTGGTTTGATIAQATAGSFKRLALEMGGKNPNIVFSDGDLDEVLPTSIRSSFSNQGQICLCGSRIFVERACYDQFVDRFVALAENLKIGDPLEAETEFGALVSQAQLDKVEYYVSLAKDEGGSIVCGGARPEPINQRCADGYFYLPTVITGLPVECRVNQEEVFGPVVTITSFDDEDEVVGYANSTRYGLAASIWTADLARAHRVAAQVESGIIWINCWMLRDLRVPFGGMKDSGLGREGGGEALRFFTEPKSICVSLKS